MKHTIDKLNSELKGKKTKLLKVTKTIERIKENLTCFICHGVLKAECVVLPCCNNLCCYGCIAQWLQDHDDCPLCRTDLSIGACIKLPCSTQLRSMLMYMRENADDNDDDDDVIEL